ncbi:hypothetical protein BKA62DRAFT_764065 [Auriculariales sp. MPI-PUGE-AT-0066]|nr:hypothetical protein BKA62DRAFT_764065 [Auriculariales sp. MPI-PUGE-AT-0066]
MSTEATAPTGSAATAGVVPPADAPAQDKGKGKAPAPQTETDDDEEEDDDDEEEDDEMDEDEEEDNEDDSGEKVDPGAILPPGARRTRTQVDYTSKEAQEKAGVANVPDDDEDDHFEGDKSMEQ